MPAAMNELLGVVVEEDKEGEEEVGERENEGEEEEEEV